MNKHIPVLLNKTIQYLGESQEVVIDATLGGGGHSEEILASSKALVIGIDQDGDALGEAKKNLANFKDRVTFVHNNFSEIEKVVECENALGKVTGIIMDLGVSSFQLDRPERGFSFRESGPLDMRMDKTKTFTAAEIVNTWREEEIANLIYTYGEERASRRIAKKIVQERKKKRFETTEELAQTIEQAVPKKLKIHPATKTFQALRIKVNEELESLEKALGASEKVLRRGGKVVVISFHSLEDRIVKRFFREMARKDKFKILTKKPETASREEMRENPRSRSAKLRVAEKI